MPTINYIDIALVAFVAVSIIIGYMRGLFITLINMFRVIVALALGVFCGNTLAEPIYESYVRERAITYIGERLADPKGADKAFEALSKISSMMSDETASAFHLDKFSLNSKEMSAALVDSVVEPIATMLIKLAVLVVVALLFLLATGIIMAVIKSSRKNKTGKKKSIPARVDKILGAVFGLVKSLIVVFTVVTVLGAVGDFLDPASNLYKMVLDSWVIKTLNDINPLAFITEV